MLARKFRFPSTLKFTSAQLSRGEYFSLRAQKNSLAYSRYGFVVSKKVDKRATIRNATKRKLRSIIEEKYLQKKGWDMLFVIKKQSIDASREELMHEVDQVIEKVSVTR